MPFAKKNIYYHSFYIIVLLLSCISCSNTKFLEQGQQLYTGADFKLESESKVSNKKEVITDVERVLVPKPNSSFLGLRPKLWFYNIAGTPKGKGLRHFLKNTLGEPPVLWERVDVDYTVDLIKNRLYNHGFFRAEVDYEIKAKRKRVKVKYNAAVGKPYKLEMIFFPDGTTNLLSAVQNTVGNTILEEGEPYNLNLFMEERERIDTELKNQGFFYFNPDYLVFRVDSTLGDRRLNAYLQLKEDMPHEAEKIYRINNVYVFPDYSLGRDSLVQDTDTVKLKDGFYVIGSSAVKPKVLDRTILFEQENKYRRTDHDYTLSRLMNLGTYKFVNVRFIEVDTTGNGFLNTIIYLTPLKKKSVRFELQGVSKSNNFVGPVFSARFLNRNFLGGAELFSFNVNTGFETQINQPGSDLNSYNVGVETEVRVPKFLTPFKIAKVSTRFMPRTRIRLGAERLSRVQYYNLNSFKFSWGYNWRESETKEHELVPFSVNFVNLFSTTERFEEILTANPVLRQSFAEQFILGPNYTFTFNDQVLGDRLNNFYFSLNADFSGNLLYAIQSLTNDRKPSNEDPYTVFGSQYSQFGKLSFDFRHYYRITELTRLASRLQAGAGLPYGNSVTLPYTKQFFIGGSNSIRAFRSRSLGPGSYEPPEGSFSFLDQAGDIKFEVNTELRYPIISILKGAVFVDAGNIWLIKDNEFIHNGKFEWDDFHKELAVGTGLGLRVDASFFVLRFDLGIPLRKPFLPEKERWVFDRIDFSSSEWRRNNLILNVAIGYPY
jgi:outer membrane protein insertion porin family